MRSAFLSVELARHVGRRLAVGGARRPQVAPWRPRRSPLSTAVTGATGASRAAIDGFPPGIRRLPLTEPALFDIVDRGCREGPLSAYDRLVSSGALERDREQAACAAELQRLWEELKRHGVACARWEEELVAWEAECAALTQKAPEEEATATAPARKGRRSRRSGSVCGGIAAADADAAPTSDGSPPLQATEVPDAADADEVEEPVVLPAKPPRPELGSHGCFIWGGVGRGKSFLMDLFAASCAPKSGLRLPLRRVHFHEFMHEVQLELHQLRQRGASDKTTRAVARRISGEVRALAFDEFQITNISDALIIETLFDHLLKEGVSVVMTSNRPPEDLYKDGLNHHLAIPQFLALLDRHGFTFHELNSARDFRLAPAVAGAATSEMPSLESAVGPWRDFFCKASSGEAVLAEWSFLDSAFAEAADSERGIPIEVPISWSRTLAVSQATQGVARFSFEELCGADLTADDYLKLADRFHTFLVTDVPHFTVEQHNEARRFTNLVDCLYESLARLVVTAEAKPTELLAQMEVLAGVSLKSIDKTPISPGNDLWGTQKHASISEAVGEALAREAQGEALANAFGGLGPGDDASGSQGGVAGVMPGALGALQESGFAARRATSRLLHMQTTEYLEAHKRNRATAESR